MLRTVFILVGLVCFLLEVSDAAVALEPANPKAKDYGGHCYTESFNLGAFADGETKPVPGQCVNAECNHSGDISYFSCGAVRAEPGCSLITDLSKPYPECCATPKC